MFQCLLCMLSSLLMLLTSLISFLVRSLYNSYLLLVFRQCFVLLSHFCFLRSRPLREIFSFPILSLPASFCARPIQHSIFLFLHFILRYSSYLFVFLLSTVYCHLCSCVSPFAGILFLPALLVRN